MIGDVTLRPSLSIPPIFSNRSYANAGNPNIDVEAWELGWNFLKDNKAKNGLHPYDENLANHVDGCGDVTGTVSIHDNVVVNQRGAGIFAEQEEPGRMELSAGVRHLRFIIIC